MYKTIFSVVLGILVMSFHICAGEQGTRRIAPKSLAAVSEDSVTSSQATGARTVTPTLDISFNRINPNYTEGDKVTITVTVRKDVKDKYLYLFNVDSAEQTSVLFPNAWHEQHGASNLIKGGTQLVIPSPENKGFHIKVVGPSFGKEKVIGILTDEPIDPARVSAKSFTAADVTPIDSLQFKSLRAVVEKKVDSIVVEKTLRTQPRSVMQRSINTTNSSVSRELIRFGLSQLR